MADSDAVRSRRKRAHAAGDHSMCRHDRPRRDRPVLVLPADPGEDFDPMEEMRDLAGRLVAAYRADPGNAALAREARYTLLAITAPDDDPGWQDLMDELSTPTYPEQDGDHA